MSNLLNSYFPSLSTFPLLRPKGHPSPTRHEINHKVERWGGLVPLYTVERREYHLGIPRCGGLGGHCKSQGEKEHPPQHFYKQKPERRQLLLCFERGRCPGFCFLSWVVVGVICGGWRTRPSTKTGHRQLYGCIPGRRTAVCTRGTPIASFACRVRR